MEDASLAQEIQVVWELCVRNQNQRTNIIGKKKKKDIPSSLSLRKLQEFGGILCQELEGSMFVYVHSMISHGT